MPCADDEGELQLERCDATGQWTSDGACYAPECEEGDARNLDCGPPGEEGMPPRCDVATRRWENGGGCVCPEGKVYDALAQACAVVVEGCDPAGVPFGGGEGTADAPYLICTVAHLEAVRDRSELETHYRLAASIDLREIEEFESLGVLLGSFDGSSRAIVGLTQPSPSNRLGLFASIGSLDSTVAGVIEDLVLRDVSIRTSDEATGALTARVFGGAEHRVERVRAYGVHMEMTSNSGEFKGGLVGEFRQGTIRDCVVEGRVLAPASNQVGGVVGQLGLGATASGLRFKGEVRGAIGTGGIVGVSNGEIRDSLAEVEVVSHSRGRDERRVPEPGMG